MNDGSRAAIRRMIRRAPLRTWIAVVTIVALGLGFLPLFGVLGFELALAMAVVGSIAGVHLGVLVARELARTPAQGVSRAQYPGRALARSTLASSALAVAVMTIPAVIAAARGLWIPTCDWTFGIVAYLAMPLASSALAGALGHAIGVAVGVRPVAKDRWWKPHRASVLAYVQLVLLALAGLWRFYSAPPVFTYNAIIGYFPGNLYDENVQLTSPLVWSRIEQLLWLVAIVALVASRLDVASFRMRRAPRPVGKRIAPIVLAIACAATATTMHHFGGVLGYAIDAEDIEVALDGRIETPHFIIHYARTPAIEKDIELIARDHELRYAQVVKQIGAAPAGKLRSFYFGNRDQKARLMGARDVEMAKPWRGEIYLDHREFPHASLRHEIAHAVASAFGDPVFGVASRRIFGIPVMISPGLVEGFAVALDWPAGYDRLTPHESVRAMQAMKIPVSIRQLLSLQFLTVSSARSYQTAGSFLKFLLDTYGAPKLREIYETGGEFDDVYGKPLDELEDEWLAMIADIALPPSVAEGNRERFRAGSVFARPCPHANAARRDRAYAAAARGDRDEAIALMRDVCKDAPDEPRYRLELGDMLAGGNTLQRGEAFVIWYALAMDVEHVTPQLRVEALRRLARLVARDNDVDRVRSFISLALTLPVDENLQRQLDGEAFALSHPGPAGPSLRGYFFFGAPFDGKTWALLATQAEPQLALGHYLLAWQRQGAAEWAGAAEEFDRALALGLPNRRFTREAARRLALTAYRTGDRARLDRAIAALHGPEMSQSDRLLGDDWAQRAAFDATGHL